MAVDLAKLRALADAGRAKQEARTTKSWFSITNRADVADVYIYEEIGGWGIEAKAFVDELRAVTAPAINLHISSPGGSVFDGLAIYEAVRQHPARVTSYVEGLAASAASFIAQAAAHRVISPNGVLLVHDAEGSAIGATAADMAEMSALLDELSENVATIYEERAGGTAKQWRERMRAGGLNLGTRYVGQAAVDAGLADEVAQNGQTTATARDQVPNMIVSAPDAEQQTDVPDFDFAGFHNALKGAFFDDEGEA